MATIPSDLTKDAATLLFELINGDNPNQKNGAFTAANVTIGAPASLTNDPSAKNTTMVLTAIPGKGYVGSQTVKYNRLDLFDVLIRKGFPAPTVTNNTFTLASHLLPSLNSQFGLNLQAEDIIDEALPAADDNGNISYSLQIAAGSLAYMGAVPTAIKAPLINLPRAMRQNILNGFVPPDTTLVNLASVFTNTQLDCFTLPQLQGTAP